jgi:hypothetical protein
MKNFLLFSGLVLTLSSCYTRSYVVGDGPQTGVEMTQKNHFVIYGLVPLSTSNPAQMAGSATNYQGTHSHRFIDGLINALTFGIYSPTTTTVTK